MSYYLSTVFNFLKLLVRFIKVSNATTSLVHSAAKCGGAAAEAQTRTQNYSGQQNPFDDEKNKGKHHGSVFTESFRILIFVFPVRVAPEDNDRTPDEK